MNETAFLFVGLVQHLSVLLLRSGNYVCCCLVFRVHCSQPVSVAARELY